MVIDPRIYESLYVLTAVMYVSSLLAVDNTKWFNRIWTGSIILGTIVGTFNLLDWIWS